MTKYEWECELKKNIRNLPEAEIKRVMEYYTELFMDKAERGANEGAIISEFGNPVDVADKILSEYYVERGAKGEGEKYDAKHTNKTAEGPTAVKAEKFEPAKQDSEKVETKVSGGRLAAFIILTVLLGWAVFTVIVCLWAAFLTIGISGGACILAGGVMIVPAIIQTMGNTSVMLVQIGLCIAAIGVGILLIVLTAKLIKLVVFLTKKLFHYIKNFIVVKKASL